MASALDGVAAMRLAELQDPGSVKQVPTRNGFGEGVIEAGKANRNILAICADLSPCVVVSGDETGVLFSVNTGIVDDHRNTSLSRPVHQDFECGPV